MKKFNLFLAAAAMSATALIATVADAHARLQGAAPAAQSKSTSPTLIKLHFSEKLASKLSGFDLSMTDGMKVPVASKVDASGRYLTAPVKTKLMPGTYKVAWHAVATDDGHRTTGVYAFTVK